MKKYLVTGVAGFLGSHLADRLLKENYDVIGIDNLIGGELKNIPQGVDFYQLDLDNKDSIDKLFAGVDVVVHAACTAYEGLSVFSPSIVVRNTTQITANVLSASIHSGVKKLVFMSSMARYGTQEKVPFVETQIPKPQDPYGIAKYSAELLVSNLSEIHGMEYLILVPHNIIGPRQKYDDPYRNVASIMINRMLQGFQPIIYGDGNQMRCFSFITDVVEPIFKACEDNKLSSEIINIGPDEELVSINYLAKLIAELLNFKLDPIYVRARPQEVFTANCSADKARKLLNYDTKVSLREGLAELIESIKSNGVKKFNYHLPIEIINKKTPDTWVKKLI